MPAKVDLYRDGLNAAADAEAYLKANSGLPGPRANLELVRAAGDWAGKQVLWRWSGSSDEFIALCGAAGLGRFALDEAKVLQRLKELAADPRWRVREGVAIALQRVGAADMDRLIKEMKVWARDENAYVQRAAAAGLCEPPLLKNARQAQEVLAVVDSVLESFARSRDRKSEASRVLRQALGYCVSVAAAAAPPSGRTVMGKWLGSSDPDVRWIINSNLGKARMSALGRDWLESVKTV